MPTFRKIVPGYVLGFLSLALSALMLALIVTKNAPAAGLVMLVQLPVNLCGFIYYFMVIHRIHRVLAAATNGKYPISGARAVGFSFIPFFSLYWKFKWPGEAACFLNHLAGGEPFKKTSWGWLLVLGGLFFRIPGISLLIGFLVMDKITKASLSVLPSAKLPVEDYTERYKGGVALAVVCILLFVVVIGILAAIAIPNFLMARNRALDRQRTAQTQPVPAP